MQRHFVGAIIKLTHKYPNMMKAIRGSFNSWRWSGYCLTAGGCDGPSDCHPCSSATSMCPKNFMVQLTNLGVGCLKEVADPSCLCLGQWSQCCRHHRVLLTTLLLPHRPQPLAETEWVGWYANSMQRTCKSSHCNHTALHGSISALTHAVQ